MLTIVTGGFALSAVAGVSPQLRTDPVSAVLAGNRLAVPYERTCSGDDGQYRQALETYGGTVSGDPRLTGRAMLALTSLTNTTTGNGTAAGTLVVTDPTTRELRFRAAVQGVVTTGDVVTNIKGVMTGLVRDRGTQAGGRLVANFQATGVGTTLYAGIGGKGTTTMPAVIQNGYCPLGGLK
jgi:hypothetical protein